MDKKSNPSIPFTAAAYKKLQAEFERLTKERIAVMDRLKIAREMGDLSENAAYHYAKFELGSVGRQLRDLKHLLTNGVVIVKKLNSNAVELGVTVTLETMKKLIKYTLVSLHESNPAQGKVSLESPLGQALLGKKIGDKVVVKTPKGGTTYLIRELS